MHMRSLVALRASLAALALSALLSVSGQAAPNAAQQPPAQPPAQPTQPPAQPAQQPTPPPTVQSPGLPRPPQGPPPVAATQAAPIQEQRGGGPVRKLALDEAVQLALEQNLDVQVERINPQLQDFAIDRSCARRGPRTCRRLVELQQHGLGSRQPVRRRAGHSDESSVVRHGRHRTGAADGHELLGGLGRVAPGIEQHLLELQPPAVLHPELQRLPAPAAGVQDRRHAHAAARPAGEPADFRRPAPAAGRDDGPQRAEPGPGISSARAST